MHAEFLTFERLAFHRFRSGRNGRSTSVLPGGLDRCVPCKVHFCDMKESREMVRVLDKERRRQGLTKQQLAEKCGLLSTTVRRLFTSKNPDTKLSTLTKLTSALGASLEVRMVDHDSTPEQSEHLIARLRRMRLSERLEKRTGLDAGDIEHALYNLTLTPTERLARRLRSGRSVSK